MACCDVHTGDERPGRKRRGRSGAGTGRQWTCGHVEPRRGAVFRKVKPAAQERDTSVGAFAVAGRGDDRDALRPDVGVRIRDLADEALGVAGDVEIAGIAGLRWVALRPERHAIGPHRGC